MRRIAFLGGAAPLGLLTGLVAWLVAGGPLAGMDRLDGLESQLSGLTTPRAAAPWGGAGASDLLAASLFALTTGPGAVREPSVRLDGLSVSRTRVAALIAFDGKPAEWVRVGETRDGVTLQGVTNSGVTLETLVGTRELRLGEQTGASAPLAPAAAASTTGPSADQIPSGFRSPPEPASAALRG